jgi:hypothetical protein
MSSPWLVLPGSLQDLLICAFSRTSDSQEFSLGKVMVTRKHGRSGHYLERPNWLHSGKREQVPLVSELHLTETLTLTSTCHYKRSEPQVLGAIAGAPSILAHFPSCRLRVYIWWASQSLPLGCQVGVTNTTTTSLNLGPSGHTIPFQLRTLFKWVPCQIGKSPPSCLFHTSVSKTRSYLTIQVSSLNEPFTNHLTNPTVRMESSHVHLPLFSIYTLQTCKRNRLGLENTSAQPVIQRT